MIRRVSRPLSAKDIGKKSKFDGANSGCKKKIFLMQFLIFFCYELIVCPLIFKSNKVYFASSLIAKPNRKPYAESFITIPPQIAKLWPKMVSPWWPKNELIEKMTPPSVVDGKIVLTL